MMQWLFDDPYLCWLMVAVVFFIIEVSTFTLIFLWLGFAALAVSAVMYVVPGMTFTYQLFLFAILSASAVLIWQRVFKNKQRQAGDRRMNNRAGRYIGRTAKITSISDSGTAKIKIDDSLWRVRCDEPLAIGDRIAVVDTDGVILLVNKV